MDIDAARQALIGDRIDESTAMQLINRTDRWFRSHRRQRKLSAIRFDGSWWYEIAELRALLSQPVAAHHPAPRKPGRPLNSRNKIKPKPLPVRKPVVRRRTLRHDHAG